MGLHMNELDAETRRRLGIKLEPELGQAGSRHIALGKVLKAINRLEEDDVVWVFKEAQAAMERQGQPVNEAPASVQPLPKKEVEWTKAPPLDWTIQIVASSFELSVPDLQDRRRTVEVAQARQVAMYICGMFDVYTLSEIGQALGGRSPATVSHGFQKIAGRLGRDKSLTMKVEAIRETVRGKMYG